MNRRNTATVPAKALARDLDLVCQNTAACEPAAAMFERHPFPRIIRRSEIDVRMSIASPRLDPVAPAGTATTHQSG